MTLVDVALGDALEVLIDHRGKTPRKLGGDWVDHGHRVVSALNIKERRVDLNDHHYLDAAMYRRWMPTPLAAGDVLLTSEAPLGEVAYLASTEQWCVGQRLFGLRAKRGLLDGRYLYYLLQTAAVRQQILNRASGSTVLGIRQAELIQVRLQLPSIVEQLQIAETLGTLDDKIESNRRICASTWTLCSVMYAELTSSGAHRPLKELLDLAYGKALPASQRSMGDVPVYGSGGMTGVHNQPLLSGPAVIVGRKGTVGSVHWSPCDCWPIDTTFYAVPRAGWPMIYIYFALLAAELSGMNSDSAVPGLNRAAALSRPVAAVEPGAASSWAVTAEALIARASVADRESRRLANLRDALLPELLSGRIRVAEAVDAALA